MSGDDLCNIRRTPSNDSLEDLQLLHGYDMYERVICGTFSLSKSTQRFYGLSRDIDFIMDNIQKMDFGRSFSTRPEALFLMFDYDNGVIIKYDKMESNIASQANEGGQSAQGHSPEKRHKRTNRSVDLGRLTMEKLNFTNSNQEWILGDRVREFENWTEASCAIKEHISKLLENGYLFVVRDEIVYGTEIESMLEFFDKARNDPFYKPFYFNMKKLIKE